MKTLDIEKLKEKANSFERKPSGKIKDSILRARRILKILERDNFSCVECGKNTKLTIDHIEKNKFKRYGKSCYYKINECQTLCSECHTKKNIKIKLLISN